MYAARVDQQVYLINDKTNKKTGSMVEPVFFKVNVLEMFSSYLLTRNPVLPRYPLSAYTITL